MTFDTMDMRFHLIAFDIPFPPNYGGAMAVFHRIRVLKEAGARITLHCFQYGSRMPDARLEQLCEAVYYYPRSRSVQYQLRKTPFIVSSRQNPDLLRRLQADDLPILFEGLHTTAHLGDASLTGRKKIVFLHNIEWQYYKGLARSESNFSKKIFFQLESLKLKNFENEAVQPADVLFCFTEPEADYYRKFHPRVYTLPAFHPFDRPEITAGLGSYALFQGNLSVVDNHRAALWLLEVFDELPYRLVLAGMSPSMELERAVARRAGAELIANPTRKQLDELVQNAQVQVLASFQCAGLKLKLLHALFQGRWCVCRPEVVEGSGLEPACQITSDLVLFRQAVTELMNRPFTEKDIQTRTELLKINYSNSENAQKLLNCLKEV